MVCKEEEAAEQEKGNRKALCLSGKRNVSIPSSVMNGNKVA